MSSRAPAAAAPAVHAEVETAEAAPHFGADWELALPPASESWVSWAKAFPEAPESPSRSASGAVFEAVGWEALESAWADAVPRRT